MLTREITIGRSYYAKVSRSIVLLRVVAAEEHVHWNTGRRTTRFTCVNLRTGRTVYKTARQFKWIVPEDTR